MCLGKAAACDCSTFLTFLLTYLGTDLLCNPWNVYLQYLLFFFSCFFFFFFFFFFFLCVCVCVCVFFFFLIPVF